MAMKMIHNIVVFGLRISIRTLRAIIFFQRLLVLSSLPWDLFQSRLLWDAPLFSSKIEQSFFESRHISESRVDIHTSFPVPLFDVLQSGLQGSEKIEHRDALWGLGDPQRFP